MVGRGCDVFTFFSSVCHKEVLLEHRSVTLVSAWFKR